MEEQREENWSMPLYDESCNKINFGVCGTVRYTHTHTQSVCVRRRKRYSWTTISNNLSLLVLFEPVKRERKILFLFHNSTMKYLIVSCSFHLSYINSNIYPSWRNFQACICLLQTIKDSKAREMRTSQNFKPIISLSPF